MGERPEVELNMKPLIVLGLLSAVLPAAAAWQVKELNGAPGLYRNGQPVAPILFWQWEIEEEDAKAMASVGVESFGVFGSFGHYDNPYWDRERGFIGTKFQDKRLDRLLKWVPDAAFLPRLFSTAPDWWVRENPDELIAYDNPTAKSPDWKSLLGALPRESYASEKLTRELSPVYRAAVRHLHERYGDHLIGIHVCNGPWGENFSWDALTQVPHSSDPGAFSRAGFGDVSKPMTRRFRRFLREKYGEDVARLRAAWKDSSVTFETASVPTRQERMRMDADGLWRDPAKGRKVPDYFECQHLVSVEMVHRNATLVKEASGGRLAVLAFYGYTQDEPWSVECDHRAISKMYRLPNVDMFSAPHTYHRRGLGEDGEMRCYLASAALHGKLFIDEGDDMTHLELRKAHPDHRCVAHNTFESVNLLYREFGNAATHGVGLWYMDLTRDTFRDPELIAAVGRMRRAAEETLTHDRAHHSEVAVVSNEESEFYMAYRPVRTPSIVRRLYREQMGEFYRAGAPFDWYLAEDLDAIAARDDVKVVALLDCEYLTDDQVAAIERMRKKGLRIVAFHAPGLVSSTGLDWNRLPETRACAELTLRSASELRAIYRAAGVHVYTDQDVVLSANRAWVMLHTRAKDDYRVKLPRKARLVKDVTCGRVVAENTDSFVYPMEKYQTAVMLVED